MASSATVRALAALAVAAGSSWACATGGVAAGPAPFPGVATPPLADDHGRRTASSAAEAGEAAARSAMDLIGSPYRFGGGTPDEGFDCSGLVAYVMARHGIQMPRTVSQQFGSGTSVAASGLREGDLVFFSTTGPGATHVGIVIDAAAREFVHAPADGSRVRVDRLDATYWRVRWIGSRRQF